MSHQVRLFDRDPERKLAEWHIYDPTTDTCTIVTEQDVTDLLEVNKAIANDAESGWRGEMHRVASIPISLYWELYQKGITRDEKKFKAWLNDSENRFFRTRPGKV